MNKLKYWMVCLLMLIIVAATPVLKAEASSASIRDFEMKGSTLVNYTGKASVVAIPTSVKTIGKEAFKGHTELVRVDIPAYVEAIEYNAFADCTSLKTVAIPDTVTKIGNGAFSGCTSLKSVKLGKKLRKIGTGVFADCVILDTMSVQKDNASFSYDDGILYDKEKTTLYLRLPGYSKTEYYMPATVKKMMPSAFWGSKNLEKVEIGSKLKIVPDYAFANCQDLKEVKMSYSVTEIGLKAFSGCKQLGETTIPASVKEIHKTAFDQCDQLVILADPGTKAEAFVKEREADKAKPAENSQTNGQ